LPLETVFFQLLPVTRQIIMKATQKPKIKRMKLPPGLTYREAADALGVSSTHLYLVMEGNRQSASLRKRAREYFATLKKQK